MRHGADTCKQAAFVGQFRLSIKDVPATGQQRWYDLYEDKRQKVKTSGRVLVRAELSSKQDVFSLGNLN